MIHLCASYIKCKCTVFQYNVHSILLGLSLRTSISLSIWNRNVNICKTTAEGGGVAIAQEQGNILRIRKEHARINNSKDGHAVFPGWECSYIILPLILVFHYFYNNNCVQIMFSKWYITLQLSCPLYFLFMRKCCRGTIIILREEVFPHRKRRKPCISTFKRVLKNISPRLSISRHYWYTCVTVLLPGWVI